MRNLSHFQSLVILSFLIFIYLIHYQSYEFLNDDAFISFRFSWNWAYHGEIVYNLGEKVEGYTNFLWVALGALILKLGGDLPTWANHLGLLFGTLTLLSLYLFRSRSKSESESESLITIFLLVSSPAYAAWSSGGLETQLFTFCFTLSWLYLLKAIESQSQNQYRLSGILMALSSMTRPEGMVLFVITAFYLGIRWLLNREKIMGFVIAFTLIFIPFYAWKWHYYGYPFPNTYYVKVGATGAWKPGLLYFGDWVLVHPWVLLPLLYLVWIGFKSLKDLIQPKYLLWAYAVFICVHVIRVGGDFMALHRFFVPILPLLAYLISPWLSQFLAIKRTKSLILTVVSLLILIGANVFYQHHQALKIGSTRGVDSIGWLKQFSEQCSHIGKWIHQNTPSDTRLATTAAGTLVYYADRYTVDLLGLNDAWIAHNVPSHGSRPGHTKSAPFKYPIDKQVNYLIYHPNILNGAVRAPEQYMRALKPYGFEWKNIKIEQMNPQWWGVFYRPIPPSQK